MASPSPFPPRHVDPATALVPGRKKADPARVMRYLLGLGVLICIQGCQTPTSLGTDAQRPYQWEDLPHHPSFAWHRHTMDSALVHVRIPAHEPLHLREQRDQPFRFALELDLLIQPLELPGSDSLQWDDGTVTLRFAWEGQAMPDRDALTERFGFALAPGRYRITHTLRDVHRGSQVTGAILMDAWSGDAPVRTFAFDPATGGPAWDMQLESDREMALLVPPDLAGEGWLHSILPPVDTFPSAPFLDRKPAEVRFPEPAERTLPRALDPSGIQMPPGDWSGWGLLTWPATAGVHRWTPESGQRHVILPARRPHFPAMRDLDEMTRAIRYIASREEYGAIREARDPKRALDAFWLQFAGSPEEARMLIRTYYGRVREANVHFSGLREGWRTDRGMVYVVFGHPDRTRRDRYGETWVYGEEGDVNALIFRFSRRNAGDDFNVFELERYPGFRSPWEAMVSSWRRGKIRRR